MASIVYRRLHANGIKIDTKLKVYKFKDIYLHPNVMPRNVTISMVITWQDKVPDKAVLKKTWGKYVNSHITCTVNIDLYQIGNTQRKWSTENSSKESYLKVARKTNHQRHPGSLTEIVFETGCTGWSKVTLINKRADHYKERRICRRSCQKAQRTLS